MFLVNKITVFVASSARFDLRRHPEPADVQGLTAGPADSSGMDIASHRRSGSREKGVRRGGSLATVTVADEDAERVMEIMNRHRPVDIDDRAAAWRETGFTIPRHTTTAVGGETASAGGETATFGGETARVGGETVLTGTGPVRVGTVDPPRGGPSSTAA